MNEILSCPNPSCKNISNGPANFCRRCGTRLVSSATLTSQPTPASPPPAQLVSNNTASKFPVFQNSTQMAAALSHTDSAIRGYAAYNLWKKGTVAQTAQIGQSTQDNDADVRYWATAALERHANSEAAPYLRNLLKDTDPDVRYMAARALQKYPDELSSAALLAALTDSDADVRYWAVRALEKLLEKSEKTVVSIGLSPFLEKLTDEDSGVRQAVAQVVGRFGQAALPSLEAGVQSSYALRRQASAMALGYIGGRDAVRLLVRLLNDTDKEVRKQASRSLVQIGAPAIEPLLYVLTNLNATNYSEAAQALANIANQLALKEAILRLTGLLKKLNPFIKDNPAPWQTSQSNQVFKEIVKLTNSSDRKLRKRGTLALGYFHRPEATTLLLKKLNDNYLQVRLQAAKALEKTDIYGIPACIEALRVNNPEVAGEAVKILHRLGLKALPALLDALKIPEEFLTDQIIAVLVKLDYETVVAELRQLLKNPNPLVREHATKALGQLRAQKAVPDLLPLLADSQSPVREQAVSTLAILGVRRSADFIKCIETSPDDLQRENAVRILGKIRAEDSLPVLLRLVKNEPGSLRRAALDSLLKIGDTALPPLLAVVQESQPEQRAALITTLGSLKHPQVLKFLIESSQSPDIHTRLASIEGLANFPGDPAANALIYALRDGMPQVENLAAATLFRMGPGVAPLLIMALLDINPKVRETAYRLLNSFGYAAIPALLDALKSPSSDLRRNVVIILGNIGTREEYILKPLRELKGGFLGRGGDPVEAVKQAAATALKQIEARK